MKTAFPFRIFYLVLCIIAVGGLSCSVKKNNFFSREYHKTLAHYNGFFNAREKIKEGAKTLSDGQVDQYDRILSVFKYGTEDQAKGVFPLMDEAIKKVSVVIQRHSMEIDGRERNSWIDDCYLVIGVAQFYKHETWTAIESFQFVAAQYRTEPIKYEALLWLSQCYMRLGKMPDAEYLLNSMKDDPKFPKDLLSFYHASNADYHLQQREYVKASEQLEKALIFAKKRPDKYRFSFILGQLYQKLEDYPKAVSRYEQCIKLSPPYEMAFNARVNRARCLDVNSPDAKNIRKMLTKMLEDEKNEEYRDQIYYALAELSLRDSNVTEAVDLLRQSVASSVSNTNQKALSYMKLAEIHFQKPDYLLAQMYYDSTAAFLSEDHPDYLSVQNTKINLNKLIENLRIIYREDSLQHLASRSPEERNIIIEKQLQLENFQRERRENEAKEKEIADKRAEEEAANNPIAPPGSKPGDGGKPGGTGWYFSNQSAVSFGFNDFIRIWGNRKLEDNWRRSNKNAFAEIGPGEEEALADSTDTLDQATKDSLILANTAKKRTEYQAAIPVTPEQKAKSDEKIVEAYYNVGLIYKEQLRDNKEAAKNFEILIQRYPGNKYQLPTYYNLYRVYLALENQEKSDYYKNIILKDYADTEYAKIILNPDFYKEQQRKVAIQKVFYENTYRAFLNKQYEDVIERKSMADSLFPGSDLTPKFDMLKTLSIGKTRPLPEFEASLKGIVTKYPTDSVSVRAQEILALMNPAIHQPAADTISTKADTTKPETVTPPKTVTHFKLMPDTLQYVCFVYQNQVVSTNDLKIALSNFNNKFYSLKKLQISNSFVGPENQLVMVRQFANKDEGMQYLDGLLSDPDALSSVDVSMAKFFVITPDNLLQLMQTKDLEGYNKFYEEQYLNN